MINKKRMSSALVAAVLVLSGVPVAPEANADGGTYVRTQSGKTRCLVTASGEGTGISGPVVVCQVSGGNMNGIAVDAAGRMVSRIGNIGAAYVDQDLVLAYGRTYQIEGWTIYAGSDGTRFTNNATGHGMLFSIGNSYAF